MCIFLGCRNFPSPCHILAYVLRTPYGPSEVFRWANLTVSSMLSQDRHWRSGTFPCVPHYPVKFLAIGVLWLCHFLAVTLGCSCIPCLCDCLWNELRVIASCWPNTSILCKERVETECSSMLSTAEGIITVLPLFLPEVARCWESSAMVALRWSTEVAY